GHGRQPLGERGRPAGGSGADGGAGGGPADAAVRGGTPDPGDLPGAPLGAPPGGLASAAELSRPVFLTRSNRRLLRAPPRVGGGVGGEGRSPSICWRGCVGVEPTREREGARATVLKFAPRRPQTSIGYHSVRDPSPRRSKSSVEFGCHPSVWLSRWLSD